MKTVSSSSHTSKRLRNLLVALLPLICGKLSAEETFHTLIAQQVAYQNQEILPQIEETQFSLELTIPSLATSLDYDLIPPPSFTLDPITPHLLEEEYMTQKRSPFRAKKTINFSKEIARDEKEELAPLPFITEKNGDPLIVDPNLEEKKEKKHDFLSDELPLNIEGRSYDRSAPYAFKQSRKDSSSLINRDFSHKKSEAHIGSSLKELKTSHPTQSFVSLEKRNDYTPIPMSVEVHKQHFDTDNFFFSFEDSFPYTPPYSLDNTFVFTEKLSRDYSPPEKENLSGNCYFAESYFKSFQWTDVSKVSEQKAQAPLHPSLEEMNGYLAINEMNVSLEIFSDNSQSLGFDDIPHSIDFPYQSHKIGKKVIENSPLDLKNFEGTSYLYVKSYVPLEPHFHYYPTREKATPLPSRYSLSEGPTLAMELEQEVISFTLTPQFDLYCFEDSLPLPKKAQEFQESVLAVMHPYLYMEAYESSEKNEPTPKPEKQEALAFNETIEDLNLNPNIASSAPLTIEKKKDGPVDIISHSIEFPHGSASSSMKFSLKEDLYLNSATEEIEIASKLSPSHEEALSPIFDSKLDLEISTQKELQALAFANEAESFDPTIKHPSFPKHHKKDLSSQLKIKNSFKGDGKEVTEDFATQNHYSPSIQKIQKSFSKTLPNFSLPKSEIPSPSFKGDENIAVAMRGSEIDYEKFANMEAGKSNLNELSLPYVRKKEITPMKGGTKPNKVAEDIPGIESIAPLVERMDSYSNEMAALAAPSSENNLTVESTHPLHSPLRPAYYPPEVPGLEIAANTPSMREKHLEYVKKKTAPSAVTPDELKLPFVAGKRIIPNKPLMTPKRAFEDLPEADKVIGLATREENFPNTREILERHPFPLRIKSELTISEGEAPPLETEMIRSQSKEILDDYIEENRLSAGLIALAKPELEGPPSESETRSLNQSNRFTRAFLTEIPPPSNLETVSYNNEFNTDVHYSKREDGKGYLFSIKMKPGEKLHFASPNQHFIFVIDGSSSIKKHRFGVFKEGVGRALSYLGEGDSFNIVVADAELTPFSKTPTSWSEESSARAKRFLIERNYRGFFINYNAFDLLSNVSNYFSPDKENIVVLITDGHSFKSINDHKEDFKELVTESKGKFSVFTATASQGNNLSMLDLLSTFNNGELMYSKTNASFSRRLSVLVKHIESLVAKDIHVNVTSIKQETGIEFYPNESTLPSLYADRPYTVYGSINELKDFDLILQGRCGEQWINIKQSISFKHAQKATHSIKKGIALQKAYVCYDYFLKNDDPFFLREAQIILEPHNVPSAVR
ncbi:MAG: hypothetical protein KFB93_01120 [Simkaniaceae bacterium]|nr:MAG: hypothetical protein KFB93_01120 [Simkaniaceae bacterium]